MLKKIIASSIAASLLFSGSLLAKGPKAPAEDSIAAIVTALATAENPADREFTVLYSLLGATGLATVLDEGGQFTVFAPTDAAFAPLLAAGALDGLTTAQVANVLLYHVTDGRRWSNSVVNRSNSKSIEMLNEEFIFVQPDKSIMDTNDINDMVLLLDDAKIDTPNVNASNGVIHIIDQVLLPASLLD